MKLINAQHMQAKIHPEHLRWAQAMYQNVLYILTQVPTPPPTMSYNMAAQIELKRRARRQNAG
ncbi:MAG TPA: hypothetical protein VII99_10515 [Bacteroidia bacterium]